MRGGSLLSRLLAVALLISALFGIVHLIAMPALDSYRAIAASIGQSQTLLQRYRALAAQRPRLEKRLAAEREANSIASAYLEAGSDALAAAMLQEQVRSVITGAGGALQSTQVLPVQEAGPNNSLRKVGLRLHLSLSVDSLIQILFELETAEPYLFIGDLSINGRQLTHGQADELQLEVVFQVFGFRQAINDRGSMQ